MIENSFSPSAVFAEQLLCAGNCARLHSITMERDQDRLLKLTLVGKADSRQRGRVISGSSRKCYEDNKTGSSVSVVPLDWCLDTKR